MARSISWPLVVLFGGVFGSACSEEAGAPEASEGAVSAGIELLRSGAGASRASLASRESLRSLTARLCDLQADIIGDNAHNGLSDSDPDDGGWDWQIAPSATSHSQSASPDNLYGAIALTPWSLLRSGAQDFRLRTALLDAALGMQSNPEIDSPPDFVYLVLLAELSENGGFSELAKTRYDARLASVGGARALAEQIRDQRHAEGYDGLIAYDIGWLTLGASALASAFPLADYDADERTYAEVVVRDLGASTPLFDLRDAGESFYTQGLAWSLLALARTGAAPSLLSEARTRLLDAQLPSGAWGWNAAFPEANLQATAEAVQALSLAFGARPSVRDAQQRATSYLISEQAANGGWLYTADEETPFVNAEIGLALFLTETRDGIRTGLDAAATARGVSALSTLATSPSAPPPLAKPLQL